MKADRPHRFGARWVAPAMIWTGVVTCCRAGGAYGAIPESTAVGPEGGRELVERTLELLDSHWAD